MEKQFIREEVIAHCGLRIVEQEIRNPESNTENTPKVATPEAKQDVSDRATSCDAGEREPVANASAFTGADRRHCFEQDEQAYIGARILVVDDEPPIHTIMEYIFRSNNFIGLHARDGREALEMIQEEPPDLVIADIKMPVMDGLELCRRIKNNPETALLPVLLLTSYHAIPDKVKGFESGADEFLPKPFHNVELVARLRAMLHLKFLRDHLESAEQVIFSLARAVEAKDAYTAGHIERVSALAVAMGKELGLEATQCAQLYRGGILHDIGKIGVPDSILNKPGKLTPEEFEQIKKHPAVGEEICHSLKTLRPVLKMVRHHHERLDGSGYPDGLVGEEIDLLARIMAVCDLYDALTSDRSYRAAMPRDEALAIIDEGVRTGSWDGAVTKALKSVLERQAESTPDAGKETR